VAKTKFEVTCDNPECIQTARALESAQEQLVAIDSAMSKDASPNQLGLVIGQNYMVRTVSQFWVGHVRAIVFDQATKLPAILVLEKATYVLDAGPIMELIEKGVMAEGGEIKGSVLIYMGSVVDVIQWPHALKLKLRNPDNT
jgi:hypothetical protein